jgi:hypothetical protein
MFEYEWAVGNLNSDHLNHEVEMRVNEGTDREYSKRGIISMITHTRRTTNVRVNNSDWRLKPDTIVYFAERI